MKIFDIAVIGAGPAGVSAALRAADQGAYVCIVEKNKIGGSCFYKGLYPFKAALTTLKSNESGVTTNGVVDIGMLAQSVENTMISISQKWENRLTEFGVKIFFGKGTPLSTALIQVEASGKISEIHTKKIIIATGSCPVSIQTLPFEKDNIISADDVFQSSTVPETVLIMGGGGNGCEIANFYQRLGSKVFFSSCDPRLITGQDPDIIDALEQSLKKLKVKLLLNKNLSSYYKINGRFDITLSGEIKFQVEKIVQNLDRKGNSSNLGCKELGVRLGERKEILVNERLETSSAGIFAVGSVTGKKNTSGVSEEEGRVAADNAMGKNRFLNSDWIPFIVNVEPEMASVGCFFDEAHHKGFRAVEGKIDSENLDFSLIDKRARGFFKIVADARNGMVIGGQIVSPNASHLISLVLLAMKKGVKVGALASLACDKSGEIQGIKEAANACNKALKARNKTL